MNAEIARDLGLEPEYLKGLIAKVVGPHAVKGADLCPQEFTDRMHVAGEAPAELEYTD